jgi:hypothetical protein
VALPEHPAGWLALLCAQVCLLPEEAIQLSPKKIKEIAPPTMMMITQQQLLCDEYFTVQA